MLSRPWRLWSKESGRRLTEPVKPEPREQARVTVGTAMYFPEEEHQRPHTAGEKWKISPR